MNRWGALVPVYVSYYQTAISSLRRGLNPMEVAAITGHKALQMLKRYTHLRAGDLVGRLG